LNSLDTYNQAIEGSATARNADGDISILSLMMNSGYDFTIKGTGITPYITAGIGVAQINIDDLAVDSPEPEGKYEVAYSESLMQGRIGGITSAGTIHENTLAYQFGAGIGIPLGNNLTIDGRYRYFATSDFTVSGTNVSLSSNTLLLGLRMEF
jgi:opacity protein-like surface antigen